jgi:O-antigen/teichoic acid export membrane protein
MQGFQVLRVATTILAGVALAKSGLSTTEIGNFETLLYIGTTASFFWINGLLMGIAPTFASTPDERKKTFISTIFWIFCGISALLFGTLSLFSVQIVPLLSGEPQLPHFHLFCAYLLLHLPSFPVEYYYLLWKQPRAVLAWGLLSFGGHLLCICLPLALGWPFEYVFYGLILLALGRLGWTMLLALSHPGRWWDWHTAQRYLRFAWPLVLSGVVGNLMLLWDNWLVSNASAGTADFAIYRYGARELPISLPLCTALGAALVPLLTEDLSAGLAELKRRSTWLMHLLFPLTVVLLFSADWLYPSVFNPDFAPSAPVFKVFLLIVASRILLPGSVLLALHDARFFLKITLLELVVRVVLTTWFMAQYGLTGVAWGVALSFWVEKIALAWRLRHKHGVAMADWIDLRWYTFYLLLLFAAYWMG